MKHIHVVGIGGAGLSAIARVLLERGESVSGSDMADGPYLRALQELGARIHVGHRAENVQGADLVVVSSAVPADNPEIDEARRLGVPVMKRSEFLGQLTAEARTIAIAGTHGKTTTTALVTLLLADAGKLPSFIVGGIIPELGANAHAGEGPHFVIEADEYDRAFLGLAPWISLITNIEIDHVDCYPCLEDATDAFAHFVAATDADGLVLYNADSATGRVAVTAGTALRAEGSQPAVQRYGVEHEADWQAVDLATNMWGGMSFMVLRGGRSFGYFDTAIPGRHNVSNALAAIAIGAFVGLSPDGMAGTIRRFHGVERRFQIKGSAAGITVVDDYAHHPTEIKATLKAARQRFPGRRLWAVFQPHTYSRTKALFDELLDSFGDADHVIVTDIFAAREPADTSITAVQLARRLASPAQYIGGLEEATRHLLSEVQPGDVVITMGAGDSYLVGDWLLASLHDREARRL